MKQKRRLGIMMAIGCLSSLLSIAGRLPAVIPLNLEVSIVENFPEEIEDKGKRVPPNPTTGTIAKDSGVSIVGVLPTDILRYEAYDSSGRCLGAFTDEKAFIDFIYSSDEVYMVYFITEEYIYYAVV